MKKELKKLTQSVTKKSDQDARNDEDEIEIPFGAKDSELQESTYYIPDGFHAEIDDDKVVIKKGEKSAAWSEEDENYLQSAENACEYQYGKNTSTILWLKSLKDRVQPQPKQEWSEEDEKIALSIEQVMNCASLLNLVPEKIEKVRAWLKSLKERIGWKPSEEQMHAFIQVYVWYSNNFAPSETLTSLYNDLKKL